MSVEAAIKGAIRNYMRSIGMDAVEVLSYEQQVKEHGYCDTCYYEETVVEVWYRNSKDEGRYWEWSGDFSSLIQTLDSHSEETK